MEPPDKYCENIICKRDLCLYKSLSMKQGRYLFCKSFFQNHDLFMPLHILNLGIMGKGTRKKFIPDQTFLKHGWSQ